MFTCACDSEWFAISFPLSYIFFTASGNFAAQSPTIKNVALTWLLDNVSNIKSISSAFHAQFIVSATLFSSVSTEYIGSSLDVLEEVSIVLPIVFCLNTVASKKVLVLYSKQLQLIIFYLYLLHKTYIIPLK